MTIRMSPEDKWKFSDASAGFTLFEAVLVILLLGVVSVYIYPKAFNTSAMTLEAQARNLLGHLQRAQLLAISTGSQVSFCTSSNAYLVQIGTAPCPTLPTTLNSTRPVQVALSNNATLSISTVL